MMLIQGGNLITIIVIFAILVLQVVVFFVTKRYALIHDVLASTVVVDMQSQMIFNSKEEMISYKEEVNKQAAEKAEYK